MRTQDPIRQVSPISIYYWTNATGSGIVDRKQIFSPQACIFLWTMLYVPELMKTGGEVEEEARLQPQGRHNTNSCLGSGDSRQRLGKIWLRYGATFFGRDLTEGFIIQHVNRTAMTDIIQFPWITCLYEIILALTGLVTVVVLHLKKMGHLPTVVKHSEEMIWWTQGWCSENNLFIFHRMFLFVEIIHNTQNAA